MTMQVEAEETLIKVQTPQYVTGILFRDRKAHVHRSSHLSWMQGWTYRAVRDFCRRQGWKIKEVD